jgi:hypothetical protein
VAWNIRNYRYVGDVSRVFNNKASTPSVLMQRIKDEGANWIIAGAKHLAGITS